MNQENKKIALFIVFLISLALILLYLEVTIFTPMKNSESEESKVAGLIIQFRDGINEQEANSILKNYNLAGYKLDFTVDMPDNYYITVDEDNITDVKNELRKENWTESTPTIEKGNYYIITKEDYYIITIAEQNIHDKNFLAMLKEHDLQVEKFVYCHIHFSERPLSGVSEEHANELKRELEKNKNIFTVYFESIE